MIRNKKKTRFRMSEVRDADFGPSKKDDGWFRMIRNQNLMTSDIRNKILTTSDIRNKRQMIVVDVRNHGENFCCCLKQKISPLSYKPSPSDAEIVCFHNFLRRFVSIIISFSLSWLQRYQNKNKQKRNIVRIWKWPLENWWNNRSSYSWRGKKFHNKRRLVV